MKKKTVIDNVDNSWLGVIMYLLGIISPFLSCYISIEMAEVDIFGSTAITRYTWVMYFFLPIEIALLLYGIFKKSETHRNVAIIFMIFIIIFGSMGFISKDMHDYTMKPIDAVSEKVSFEFPEDVVVASTIGNDYIESRIKIKNDIDRQTVLENIKNDNRWTDSIRTILKNSFSHIMSIELSSYDYFMYYNETSAEFNTYPSELGEYKIMLLAYNAELGAFLIINEYTFQNE